MKNEAKQSNRSCGFTLVELSLVIVIIGLIVAGIVGGQSLVRQGRILSQISELKKYEVAFNDFILEYDAVPGDFRSASSYWAGTPDGDGNGRILHNGDDLSPEMEGFLFFEHLSKAALIAGNFDASSASMVMGVAFPALKIDPKKGMTAAGHAHPIGTAFQVQLSGAKAIEPHIVALYMQIGRPNEVASDKNDLIGVASPKVMQTIDKKMDDGVARTGRFRAYRAYNSSQGNCLTGDDGDYLVTNELPACHAEYIIK